MNYLQDKGLYYCLFDLCVFTNKAVIEKDNAGKDDAGKSEGWCRRIDDGGIYEWYCKIGPNFGSWKSSFSPRDMNKNDSCTEGTLTRICKDLVWSTANPCHQIMDCESGKKACATSSYASMLHNRMQITPELQESSTEIPEGEPVNQLSPTHIDKLRQVNKPIYWLCWLRLQKMTKVTESQYPGICFPWIATPYRDDRRKELVKRLPCSVGCCGRGLTELGCQHSITAIMNASIQLSTNPESSTSAI